VRAGSSEIPAFEDGRRGEEERDRVETRVGDGEEKPFGLDGETVDREPARVEDLEMRQEPVGGLGRLGQAVRSGVVNDEKSTTTAVTMPSSASERASAPAAGHGTSREVMPISAIVIATMAARRVAAVIQRPAYLPRRNSERRIGFAMTA
jgi:hypothetical protein